MQPCSPLSLLSPVPPTIADDLTDVVVTRLSPAILTCYASGVPPPAVSWSKEGAQLGSRGGGYRVLPRGTAQGSTAQAGTGVPASPPACTPALPAVLQEPWRSGRRCLLTAAATPAQLGAPRARRGNTSGSLCMVHTRLQAPAAGASAPSSHSSTSLLFTEPPALKPLPGMVMVMVNTSAVLNCEATGVPRPEVTWQKDGVGITGGEQECAGGWQSPHYLPAFT